MQRAPVVDHQQFAVGVHKADDLMRGVGQFGLFGHLFAIVAQSQIRPVA